MRISDWSSDVCSSDLGMAEDEIELQLLELAGVDAGAGEQPETSVDAIGGLAVFDQLRDDLSALIDRPPPLRGEADQDRRRPDAPQFREIDRLLSQMNGLHRRLATEGRSRPLSRAQDRKSTRLNSRH